LVRRFQKGSGRYKGKSPLKCFNCGRIGHIVENSTIKREVSKIKRTSTPRMMTYPQMRVMKKIMMEEKSSS
jgi:hypothetical protein